jgi:DNA-directed RNA polymerase specialized sigma24 family protein
MAQNPRAQTRIQALEHWILGGRAKQPVSLAGYLMRAVRHRMLRIKRESSRRDTHYSRAATGPQGAIASVCSENSLRTSRGIDDERGEVDAAVAPLMRLLMEELSEVEVTLLMWSSEAVPYRQMAEWLDVGYEAMAKRMSRLRARLRSTVLLRLNELPSSERTAVVRFLGRIGVDPVPSSVTTHDETPRR